MVDLTVNFTEYQIYYGILSKYFQDPIEVKQTCFKLQPQMQHSELLRETIHSLAIGAFYQSDGSRAIFQVFSEQLIKYFCNFFIF